MASTEPDPPAPRHAVSIHFDRTSLWRAGWVVIMLVAAAALLKWVLEDAGSIIFTLTLALLASIAMEPAVGRLSQHVRRGLATAIVMVGLIILGAGFLFMFGRLLSDQIGTFAQSVPDLVQDFTDWASQRFGVDLDYQHLVDKLGGGTGALTSIAQNLAGGVLGIVASILSAAFSTLTFAFFTFYFSADSPRLRRWIAELLPPKRQEIFAVAWTLALAKTGGYVSARLVLAAICGGSTALFMLAIGMPYWLALGIWTGVVAQFVPTVGTYIAIALPVVVGLVGDQPWQGLAVLAFAVVYQQIENVTIEPRISAQAVDVHPAVSFASVMFGASLFGVGGAFVAVPVAALLIAMFDIYVHKYDVLPQGAPAAALDSTGSEPPRDSSEQAQVAGSADAAERVERSASRRAAVATDE
jgi:predicted PurR-regulated permease PerM